MGDIGEQLRRARQEKGLSLREAEEATKIRVKYLNALEEGLYEDLPGRVYAIGFLRTYAHYLGLNADALVQEFKDLMPLRQEEPPSNLIPGERVIRRRRRWRRIFIISAIVLALIGVNRMYHLNRDLDQPSPPPAPFNSGSSPTDAATPSETKKSPVPPPKQPQISGVEVKVVIKNSECWVRAVVDGKEEFQGILKKGEERLFRGREKVYIKLGNAGVVSVIHNGQTLPPLGKPGEVIEKTFTAVNSGN